MSYTELYENNEEFKAYVDKYSNQRKITIEEALSHALVKSAGDYYTEKKTEVKENV